MEIVLLLAMLAVGGSALYVSASFRTRTTRTVDWVVRDVVAKISETSSQRLEPIESAARAASRDSAEALTQIRAISRELAESQSGVRSELAGISEALARNAEAGDRSEANGQWVAEQAVGLIVAVQALQRGQQEILGLARYLLDRQALTDEGDRSRRLRVISVSLRVAAAEAAIRELLASFCDRIGLEVILQAEPGASRGPYLSWHAVDGWSLEEVMAALLASVPNEQRPGEDGPDGRGLDELRRLVLALHECGPGTIRIGPLILNSTGMSLLGRLVTAREMAALDSRALTDTSPDSAGTAEPASSARSAGRVPTDAYLGRTEAPHHAAEGAAEVDRWLRDLDSQGQAGSAALELTAWATGFQ